jgi:hypothetical protein
MATIKKGATKKAIAKKASSKKSAAPAKKNKLGVKNSLVICGYLTGSHHIKK